MKKSFEDKVRKLIADKEKSDKVKITYLEVIKKTKIGFLDNSEVKVNYHTDA